MYTFNQYHVATNFNFHFGRNSFSTMRVNDGAFVHHIATMVRLAVVKFSIGIFLMSSLVNIS